jgi:predicted methyltransferase
MLTLLAFLLACAPEQTAPEATPAAAAPAEVDYDAIVAAADRTEADRALDAGRHPAELLRFFEIRPGMKVADIGAGGGYTTELLARIVGPEGRVYGVNSPVILERFAAAPWAERLQRPVNANVTRLDREFDDPFPDDVQGLDAVLNVLFYHDTVWLGTDRARMNADIFAALKPGGIYGIVDHVAKPGAGVADVQTLHRIEPSVIVEEVKAAGFVLDGEGDFLRNPQDTYDWNPNPREAGERRGTSDRVVMRFRKP